jgi:putative peptidoglycan lipid II flippase
MLAMTAIRRGGGRGDAPYYSAGVPPDPSVTSHDAPAAEAAVPPRPSRRRISVNTAIFSIGTGASRVAGLVREILASSYFATSGAFSAFTIAFQIPNLLRQLVADYAVSAAFVPVFTELLEKDRKRDAFKLASTLFFLILLVLGAITALFVIAAPTIMPLFTGDTFSHQLDQLTAGLSQVLFPIVVLLGLNGLCVGILNAYDHFTVPGFAPLAWNVVIIGLLIALRPLFSGPDQLYAYAIAVLVGTAVQFALALPVLAHLGFRLHFNFDWRDPRVAQVLRLLLPVTLALGVINFDLVINATLGSLVSDQAPRAIDAAFRIYMLPQGMFSVALATVLFPALARFAARRDHDRLRAACANGMRQIFLLLIPAAAITIVLATPIVRLIYQHGNFGPSSTDQVSEALFWFSFSLPLNGVNLLLTRTFFSLQEPWRATQLAAVNVAINFAVSLALYQPFGIAGLVIGTVVGNAGMLAGQAFFLRRELRGLEGRRTALVSAQVLAASAALAGVSYAVWYGLDAALGRGLLGQIVSVVGGIAAGGAVYAAAVTAMRIQEANQIRELVASRLRRRDAPPAP